MKPLPLITLISLLFSINAVAQTQYQVADFSKRYKGKITITNNSENEVFKKGNISIFDKKTNKQIINIASDNLSFELDKNNKVKANVLQLPYGEQSLIIYQDFNFDGKKDLAVMDGQFSCYGGPSFQIYLATKKGLQHSPKFSELAQNYCGMFQVNNKMKTIHTMTKSGCCWHQYSTFKVMNNIPKPIEIVEEGSTGFPFYTKTIIQWKGKKKITKVEKIIDLQQEEINEILSFKLANKKQVVIFSLNQEILYYVLIRPDKTVEFSYPLDNEQKSLFTINKKGNRLTFQNKNAVYEIYETGKNARVKGVRVKINGKIYNSKGVTNSAKGSLQKIKTLKLDNVRRE